MSTKDTLLALGIAPKKYKGQNFLSDPGIIASIVNFAGVTSADTVVEVGPGLGILTKALLPRCNRLLVVEIERAFCDYLEGEITDLAPADIICDDIRRVTPEVLKNRLGDGSFNLISNVPYAISSELILWAMEHRHSLKQVVLLLQREFSERIAAAPGSRTYGSLSVLTSVYFTAELGMTISGSAFYPRADVESRLLRLSVRPQPVVSIADEQLFRDVVRAAFGQRRKTLGNAISSSGRWGTKSEVARLLASVSIDSSRRAESLSASEFARIADAIRENAGD